MARKSYLLVGTELGIFVGESSAARRKWSFRGPYLSDASIFCCASDLRGPRPALYAGGESGHWGPVFRRSGDMGKTWREVKRPPRFGGGSKLSVDAIWQIEPDLPPRRGSLYAGTSPAALFHSADGGETWTEMTGLSRHETRSRWRPCRGGLCLHSISIDPADAKHIVTGISAVGVFESLDCGESWRLANEGLPSHFHPGEKNGPSSCVHKLARGAAPSEILYQQNHSGVWIRPVSGSKWIRADRGLPSSYGFAIAAHPRDPETAYVIPHESPDVRAPSRGNLSVFRTNDRGKTWKRLHDGLPPRAYVKVLRDAFCADREKKPGLYFGTTGGQIFESLDGGESWFAASAYFPKIFSVRAFSIK